MTAEEIAAKVRGWRTLGSRKSNGEVMCAGCWDRSEYDTDADHDIPIGHDVWWSSPHPEYGDCDAYCTKCVVEDAEAWEIMTDDDCRAILESNHDRA